MQELISKPLPFKLSAGPPPRRTVQRSQLEIAAYHEAGHVVVALALGRAVREVGLHADWARCGSGWMDHSGPPRARDFKITPTNLRRYWVRAVNDAVIDAKICMAGPLAEARYTRRSLRDLGRFKDLEDIIDILTRVERVRQSVPVLADDSLAYYKRGLFDRIAIETAYLLGRRGTIWRAVGALAKALLLRQRLSRDEVIDVVERVYTPQNQLQWRAN